MKIFPKRRWGSNLLIFFVFRVPLVEEKALPESALDVIVNALKVVSPVDLINLCSLRL